MGKLIAIIGLGISLCIGAGKESRLILSSQAKDTCFTCNDLTDGIIFCDDFESEAPLKERYYEYDDDEGDFVRLKNVGRNGSAGMRVIWQPGEMSAGSLKKSFGRTPDEYIGKHAAFPGKDFNEIYWRIDIKRQDGWEGGGGEKLTRAMAFAGPHWCQGMIGHLWSSGDFLVMDPASGIDDNGTLRSTRYNDFAKLRWLGNKKGTTALFSDANAGEWYCVVGHVKLNTPGKADGVFEFWIDNELQAGSYHLNWHGNWNADTGNYKINAVFFENYWSGAPKLQERYFDNILISTKPVKCDCD